MVWVGGRQGVGEVDGLGVAIPEGGVDGQAGEEGIQAAEGDLQSARRQEGNSQEKMDPQGSCRRIWRKNSRVRMTSNSSTSYSTVSPPSFLWIRRASTRLGSQKEG